MGFLYSYKKYDIFDLAVKYFTKIVNKLCCHTQIVPQPMYSAAADIVFVDKHIRCYALFFHCIP